MDHTESTLLGSYSNSCMRFLDHTVRFLDHNYIFNFLGISILFFTAAEEFYFLITMCKGPNFSISSPSWPGVVIVVYNIHPNEYEVILHNCFDLHFSND